MSIPVWVLMGFAGWTIIILLSTIAVYRWNLILKRKASIIDFPADVPHGEDWYRRAMRAHANCIENLPIYTAIVIAILVTDAQSRLLDVLAIVLLIARIFQSLMHILFEPSKGAVSLRFGFFTIQLICMIWMGIYVCISA